MIFSPNISSVDGGVHGREAIVLGSLCITTVDHGAPRRKGLHNAICSVSHDGLVICACAAGTRARVAQHVREAHISFLIEKMKWKNHFSKMKGDVGMSGHEKERKQEDAYTKIQTHS